MSVKPEPSAQNASVETKSRNASRRWRRVLAVALIVVAVLAVGYFALSFVIADQLARPERHPFTNTPALYGLKYEDVKFSSTDNIPLAGWYIDSPGDRVILLLHGRNGARDGGVNLMVANELAKRNYDVLMFDFRGHGASGGQYYSLGLLEERDIAGALNYLKTRGVNEVGAIGFSMGGATLLNSAPEHPEIRALVADSPFADANPLVAQGIADATRLPSFFNPGILFAFRVLVGADLTQDIPANAIRKLGARPLLLIYGTKDDLIPQWHFAENTRAGQGNPNFQVWGVEGAGHTTIYETHPQEYAQRVGNFFDANLK